MTTKQITDIYTQMKEGKHLSKILPNATSKEYYFFIKGYKLANEQAFYKNTNADIKALCIAILEDHYPPLEYCHKAEDGYEGLDTYIAIAKTIFKD